MLRVTKWIATFVGGLIRFPKENNALSARNIVASLTFQAAYDERRIEQPLLSLRWMKTDELLHHHDGHGFTSHIIRRGKVDIGRVTRGEHQDSKQIKKNDSVYERMLWSDS